MEHPETSKTSVLDIYKHTEHDVRMRTTLDIPGDLMEDARRLLGFKSKSDTVIVALRELLRRHRLEQIKDLYGEVEVEVDRARSRRRPGRKRGR